MDVYTCKNCGDEFNPELLCNEGEDEDEVVMCASCGLCLYCYTYAVESQEVYPNQYDLMGEY